MSLDDAAEALAASVSELIAALEEAPSLGMAEVRLLINLRQTLAEWESSLPGMRIHTIPVPVGWTPEQAWEAIRRGELLEHPDGEPSWANIETRDGRMVRLLI